MPYVPCILMLLPHELTEDKCAYPFITTQKCHSQLLFTIARASGDHPASLEAAHFGGALFKAVLMWTHLKSPAWRIAISQLVLEPARMLMASWSQKLSQSYS
jgi:hypothetical protein